MIDGLPFRDRKVAVLGLARSGRVAAEALLASGAHVLAWDDHKAARDACGHLPLVDLAAADPRGWSALVMSPGIPLTNPAPHPVAARARAAGVEIIGDIELLARAGTGASLIGITGTNGKSTTTALIGHILKSAGRAVAIGGNLGIPVLSFDRLGHGGVYVIEMSSYQLDLVREARFDVALLLNFSPDHLDRHGDMAGYIAAKRRIFRNQRAGDSAVIGMDDPWSRAVADTLAAEPARLIRISTERKAVPGIHAADGILIDAMDGTSLPVLDLARAPSLPGRHNWQNAAAAYAACRALGLAADDIAAALQSFPGLAHRQEHLATINGVRFVNDSKATNADAAAKALGCYEAIYWIAGGIAKAGGITPLAPFFPRIKHAFLIGEAAPEFATALEGKVPFTLSGDLATATRAAARAASRVACETPVVLLSPACASFDQYPNFEVRGDAFRHVVAEIRAELSE